LKTPQLIAAALCLFGLALGIAACGDDDDERLTDEEYFAEVDTLNQDFEQTLEQDVFAAETAKEGVDSFLGAAQGIQDGLADLEPPEDLQDPHDAYVAGVDDAVEYLEGVSEDTPEDAPADELESILFADEEAFVAVEEAECELTSIAEEREIELEFLFCDESAGPEAAGDNPVAVEATEFEFTLDGEFSTDTTGFVLTNAGEQPHEAFISMIPEDADLEELLASEETPEGVVDVGGTFSEPGVESGFAFEEPLEPGRYVMLCFVEDEETGQPHAALGMVAEFTVE
jgi:hypothetical protein